MIKSSNINLLKNNYDENRLSHVFLIETNNQKQALSDIIELVKYINCDKRYEDNCTLCNLCHLIEKNSLPNLKIIYPDGQNIKKEQMENLKNDFSHIPFISKYNIYVISEAEKFNQSSANAILKFIEEPEDNIIGFLITNNKENVIPTIKSRCSIINAWYDNDNSVINVNEDLVNKYINDFEINKKDGIIINKMLLDEKVERQDLIEIFKYILNYYQNLLKQEGNDYNLKIKDIIKRIKIIEEVLERLNYNVNINLVLDYFIIKLEEL